jgi:hypothetical protein
MATSAMYHDESMSSREDKQRIHPAFNNQYRKQPCFLFVQKHTFTARCAAHVCMAKRKDGNHDNGLAISLSPSANRRLRQAYVKHVI